MLIDKLAETTQDSYFCCTFTHPKKAECIAFKELLEMESKVALRNRMKTLAAEQYVTSSTSRSEVHLERVVQLYVTLIERREYASDSTIGPSLCPVSPGQ